MKNSLKSVLVIFFLFMLGGCQTVTQEQKNIFELRDSYIGNNSAINSIINYVEDESTVIGFELETNQKPYGLRLMTSPKELADDQKAAFIKIASYIFTLTKNCEWVEMGGYTVTKEALQSWLDTKFETVKSEKELQAILEQKIDLEEINHFLEK